MNKFASNTSFICVLIPINKKSQRAAIDIVETCNRHEFGSNPGPCCLVLVGSRNGPLTYVNLAQLQPIFFINIAYTFIKEKTYLFVND